MKTVYLHTLDGVLASYEQGEQVCFLMNGSSLKIVSSLREIRVQQKSSRRWRKDRGFQEDSSTYGYLRVKI